MLDARELGVVGIARLVNGWAVPGACLHGRRGERHHSRHQNDRQVSGRSVQRGAHWPSPCDRSVCRRTSFGETRLCWFPEPCAVAMARIHQEWSSSYANKTPTKTNANPAPTTIAGNGIQDPRHLALSANIAAACSLARNLRHRRLRIQRRQHPQPRELQQPAHRLRRRLAAVRQNGA
jgi:hypothetical protein